jgi:hypothetical protein
MALVENDGVATAIGSIYFFFEFPGVGSPVNRVRLFSRLCLQVACFFAILLSVLMNSSLADVQELFFEACAQQDVQALNSFLNSCRNLFRLLI